MGGGGQGLDEWIELVTLNTNIGLMWVWGSTGLVLGREKQSLGTKMADE